MTRTEKKVSRFCRCNDLTYDTENLPGGFIRYRINCDTEKQHCELKPICDKAFLPDACFGLWDGHPIDNNIYVMSESKFNAMESIAQNEWGLGFTWYMETIEALQRYSIRPEYIRYAMNAGLSRDEATEYANNLLLN